MEKSVRYCPLFENIHSMIHYIIDISKNNFYPGGMAPSEWTRFIRAIRDSQVVAYPVPAGNTTPYVAYRPPIIVSPSVLTLSVPYLKWTLGQCGQRWPYGEMGSLGTPLHRDCNAMGDAAKPSPSVPSACAQDAILSLLIIHTIPSCQIYVANDNPSLIPSVSCLTPRHYLWNYVHAANNVSYAWNFQSNRGWCFSHLYTFRIGMQVTRVLWHCGERQGWPVPNESADLVQELDYA